MNVFPFLVPEEWYPVFPDGKLRNELLFLISYSFHIRSNIYFIFSNWRRQNTANVPPRLIVFGNQLLFLSYSLSYMVPYHACFRMNKVFSIIVSFLDLSCVVGEKTNNKDWWDANICISMSKASNSYCPCPPSLAGMERMMSESPGSVMESVQTRKYLPQAVPNSMLLPV